MAIKHVFDTVTQAILTLKMQASHRLCGLTFSPAEPPCSRKGVAGQDDIVVNGDVVKNAAWTYPEPKRAAQNITRHVAFYGMVTVEP